MAELQPLTAAHAGAVLAFEQANRPYFARSISDRGDDWFEHFADRHAEMLAEQSSGVGAFHLLVDGDGSVLGRFNLRFGADGVAVLGYRMAEAAAGRGLATAAVGELCLVAGIRYDVHLLRAATSDRNAASQRVLLRNGFAPVGPAGPADLGGQRGSWYERMP